MTLARRRRAFYFSGMKKLAIGLIALSFSVGAGSLAPVAAQSPTVGAEPPPTINVSTTATVRRTPDVAVIQLAVETVAPTAREASDQTSAIMDEVLAAVRAQGVPASMIRTERLELQPRYEDRREGGEPRILGYRAANQVTVRLEDVTMVGGVVDAAVRAGANRVTGISFELADPESAYHEALRQAIAKARSEAEVAATALGLRLGEAVQVSTGGFQPPFQRIRTESMAMGDMAQAAPPVEPGEVEVQATVSIAWRLGS